MGPAATQIPPATTDAPTKASKTAYKGNINFASLKLSDDEIQKEDETYEYNFLRPAFPKLDWEPLKTFEVLPDKAHLADPKNNFANLFRDATTVTHINPKIGTEVTGVDLANLDDEQKNELALLLATRVAVIFRDQKNLDIYKQLELGRYYGTLHKHATTSLPRDHEKDLEEVHVIWADEKRVPITAFPATYLWHSDVTYEKQPPSYTSLKVLKAPSTGGDTLWISGYALYDALSPGLKEYLEGLTALHSGKEQADDARRKGTHVRREPVITEHPLVRVHPVTGYKAVFVNPGFTRSIVGVPKAESDAILQYLFNLIATTQESTVRFKWNKDDVVFWDNRIAVHTATYGFFPERRHGVRVTSHGEVPYYDPNGKSQQAVIDAQLGIERNLDGSKGGSYND